MGFRNSRGVRGRAECAACKTAYLRAPCPSKRVLHAHIRGLPSASPSTASAFASPDTRSRDVKRRCPGGCARGQGGFRCSRRSVTSSRDGASSSLACALMPQWASRRPSIASSSLSILPQRCRWTLPPDRPAQLSLPAAPARPLTPPAAVCARLLPASALVHPRPLAVLPTPTTDSAEDRRRDIRLPPGLFAPSRLRPPAPAHEPPPPAPNALPTASPAPVHRAAGQQTLHGGRVQG